MMKKTVLLALAIILTSCSKLQEHNILGVWTVENIEWTFTTDGNIFPFDCKEINIIFYEGEQVEFTKTAIIPCPSIISVYGLNRYPEFQGSFAYLFDSVASSITFPERHFEVFYDDPVTGYHGHSSLSISAITYNVIKQDGNTLCLTLEKDVHDENGTYIGVDHYRVVLRR